MAYDILLVGMVFLCLLVVVSARPDTRAWLPALPPALDRLLRLSATWEYWIVGASLGLVALRFVIGPRDDRAPASTRGRMTSGIVDISGITREQPDALERLQTRFAAVAHRADAPAVDLVEDIILAAALVGASDVHMEPSRTRCACRFASTASCATSPRFRRPSNRAS